MSSHINVDDLNKSFNSIDSQESQNNNSDCSRLSDQSKEKDKAVIVNSENLELKRKENFR